MRAGAVTGTEHGASYWFHDVDDVGTVNVKSDVMSRVLRYTSEDGSSTIRIDIDARDCELKQSAGFRPKVPVIVEVTEDKKKQTLTLA